VNDLWKYLTSGITGGAIVVVLVVWGIHNLDKVELVASWIYRGLSWLHSRWEYGNVAYSVQAGVNTFGERLNTELPGVLPHRMKIEWAHSAEDVKGFLRDGHMVVTMDYSRNRDRNLVVSTLAYLKADLLPYTRPYVKPALMKATDFTIAKNLIASCGRPLAITILLDEHFDRELRGARDLRHYCSLLDRLSSAGLLTRVFLRELHSAGQKMYLQTPNESIQRETAFFAEFLGRIQAHSKGEKVIGGLAFVRSVIRTSVMLVAKNDAGLLPSLGRYIRPTRIDIDRGIETM